MNLDISKITSCGSDWETNRYTLLQTISKWQSEIRKNKLYPAIEQSWQLQNKFNDILSENIESKYWLEKEVKGAFIDDKLVLLEKAHQISFQLDKLIDFVKWGLNENIELLDEAEIIKEFVNDNLQIKTLCNKDKYRGKGFILIPDNKIKVYKIYLYELSINWLVDEPVEYLEMELLRSIPLNLVDLSPSQLMYEFVKNTQTIYDPMVYVCETDLDFAFNDTILPIVKSKLLDVVNGLYPYI
ncbi:MAG: hypothetical protein IPH97_04280 [Ignavibacteriales bacterium]|nr:hypothetical protein [Ignavibacteriales bacterium]